MTTTGGAAAAAEAFPGGLPTRPDVAAVESKIRPYIRRTPVVTVDLADFGRSAGPLTIKLEQLQYSGAFKVRGAFANLLLRDIPPAGVVAASGGNHGAAVAYAAGVLGIPARVFVPEVSSPAKISRIRDYGADLVVQGANYPESLDLSQEWAATSGALPIHAYDQAETILGAGTVGLELLEQAPHADTVLTSVGGGGLLAGTATACADALKVVGAEPEGAPSMSMALAAGQPVDSPVGSVAVDSLAPRQAGRLTFAVAAARADSVVLVTDEAILDAQRQLWERLRLVAEPGGVAALAAILSRRYVPAPAEHVVVVVSGANTTAVDFTR